MKEKFGKYKFKQHLMMLTAFAGFVTLVFVGSSLLKSNKNTEVKKEINMPEMKLVSKEKQEKDSFKRAYDDKLTLIDTEIKNLKKQNEDLVKKLEEEKKKNISANNENTALNTFTNEALQNLGIKVPPVDEFDVIDGAGNNTGKQNKNENNQEYKAPVVQTVVKKGLLVIGDSQTGNMIKDNNLPNNNNQSIKNDDALIKEVSETKGNEDNANSKQNEKKADAKKFSIPAGTFVKAVLINGLDAPTSANAKNEPHPVTIRITSLGNMPNNFKTDIKECRAITGVYGDLSSERAIFRVENLTCLNEKGEIYTTKENALGYVTGESAKIGLRGRVVSRQGAILGRALMAGFVEGMGEMFKNSASTVTTSTTGTMTTLDPNKTLQAGVFGGFSKSAEKLSDYYLSLNNQMFPVIEINAGRDCELIFNKNFILEKVEL